MLKLVTVDWKSQEEVQIGVSLFVHRLKKNEINISERQQKNSGLTKQFPSFLKTRNEPARRTTENM